MARFTRAELETFRDASVPDLLGTPQQPVRLLFVGINPGLWTAATQTHFAHPGNRFYPALHLAGILERRVDPAAGMSESDRDHLRQRGIGITNLAHRATARADELTEQELQEGGVALGELVGRLRPRVVAVAGVTAYRMAAGVRRAVPGRQLEPPAIGGRPWPAEVALWVVPNPSGLNAHETVASLAEAYAAPAREAGLVP